MATCSPSFKPQGNPQAHPMRSRKSVQATKPHMPETPVCLAELSSSRAQRRSSAGRAGWEQPSGRPLQPAGRCPGPHSLLWPPCSLLQGELGRAGSAGCQGPPARRAPTHRHRQLPLRGAQRLVDGAVDDFVGNNLDLTRDQADFHLVFIALQAQAVRLFLKAVKKSGCQAAA